MITTNAIAREQATYLERQRTAYAITAHIADLEDRVKQARNDFIKQAWTVAIIELRELQRTLERKNAA